MWKSLKCIAYLLLKSIHSIECLDGYSNRQMKENPKIWYFEKSVQLKWLSRNEHFSVTPYIDNICTFCVAGCSLSLALTQYNAFKTHQNTIDQNQYIFACTLYCRHCFVFILHATIYLYFVHSSLSHFLLFWCQCRGDLKLIMGK